MFLLKQVFARDMHLLAGLLLLADTSKVQTVDDISKRNGVVQMGPSHKPHR